MADFTQWYGMDEGVDFDNDQKVKKLTLKIKFTEGHRPEHVQVEGFLHILKGGLIGIQSSTSKVEKEALALALKDLIDGLLEE